jgi:hypothetical protein
LRFLADYQIALDGNPIVDGVDVTLMKRSPHLRLVTSSRTTQLGWPSHIIEV